jgi:hypothetical protein
MDKAYGDVQMLLVITVIHRLEKVLVLGKIKKEFLSNYREIA